MKKLITLLMVFAVTFTVNAQIETPQPSPLQKIEQKVGLTDVSVQYSRPSMKGRTIFGDLVPYGKLWRTGANQNTMVTFSTDVMVGESTLKAGSYAIFSKPNKDNWEVIFYSDTNNWGTPQKWDDSKVAAKVNAKVYDIPMDIETFTVSFDDLTNDSAVLGIMWEKTYVAVKFEVPTDKAVTAAINNVMNGPSADDYYAAARYYLESGKDINKAVVWMDKAIEMTKENPRFWWLRQQSLIKAKAGDKKGAIKAAKASLEGAEKAGNADYIKMNKDSLKEWGAM
ncbi:hypothetical protein FHS04_000163 [Mesoflavibacter sabulilitoris]|uniref:Dihydrolipoamide dehydrogenase n=1 Tax=Mesoflavibacter zeaxanthinifaciens subsp. sabulilitoris TaxID=1520893 RepID=A0A2T1NHB9_9FLAO|nr:DUF2911 domain-containing protein [Mesoflavibacter zeaxanthinifaciens]MBB3122675.1 hypothetical protein [Mesoflavibacter zeaxanthinifaciens subsp. sabulilitoris]PSG92278.1 dihydrolipoamide dehydrogenase [Mesoflavibacter zeaxanthinifaciens subsp. sabulilitoris]